MTNFFKQHRLWQAVIVLIIGAVIYWGLIASNRYVSEAHIVVERTDVGSSQAMDFTSLLPGGGGNPRDLLLLRDHLLSVDMLRKLDARLKLRQHYSGNGDPLSRMWFKDASMERFHQHFLSRVSAEFDDFSGVLVIKSQAFAPELANKITRALVEEGERYMNELAHKLALEQVDFIERQVRVLGERLNKSRQAVLAYQNTHKLVSPGSTVESLSSVIAHLEGQAAELKARKLAMESYLEPSSPDVRQITMQIAGLERQVAAEKARLTSSGTRSLNQVTEQFERLQMESQFAQDLYKTALAALEKARVESIRTLKKVSILQSPTLPEYPLEPRRLYNIVTFIIFILMLAGIIHLITAIVRDHKD